MTRRRRLGDDPRLEFVKSLSIELCRAVLKPEKIFFFGGSLDNDKPSVRKILSDYIFAKQESFSKGIVFIEDFTDWLHDSHYPDLVKFETDLAETGALIILALESPGAIAELGCFSVNEKLKKKLLIVMCDKHYEGVDSFIRLGPLRQLNNGNILAYSYNYSKPNDDFHDHCEDVALFIRNWLEKSVGSEAFDKENNGHIAFLIKDLISVFHALIRTEILEFLEIIGISYDSVKFDRTIFLLTKLDLIKRVRVGNSYFYVSICRAERMEFRYKAGVKWDRSKITMASMAFYHSNTNEKRRLKALKNR